MANNKKDVTLKMGRPSLSEVEAKGDNFRKKLKKAFSKKNTSENPMKMDRKKEGYRSKVQKAGGNVKFADEFSLNTLTSKGPGKLELSKGGRAAYKMGGKCKIAKKGKGRAYGKNS